MIEFQTKFKTMQKQIIIEDLQKSLRSSISSLAHILYFALSFSIDSLVVLYDKKKQQIIGRNMLY